MTANQKKQFNAMLVALRTIGKGYQTSNQIRKNSEKEYGLDFEDALEMSYDNIQVTARVAIKGVKHIN